MINVFTKKLQLCAWALLLTCALAAPATAGVPLEVGLYKSILVDFKKQNRKIVLVTLANTKKEAKEKDVDQMVTYAQPGNTDDPTAVLTRRVEGKKNSDTDTGNTNKFVVPEILSEYVLKLDGITIGSTSMIIWTKGEGGEKPVPTFFDLKVTGDREAIENQLKETAPNDTINVQYANDTVVLSGNVANEQTRNKAQEIAKAYAPKVLNNITINEPQQVLLQVKVAQVDRTALRNLGISALIKGASAEGGGSAAAPIAAGTLLGNAAGLTGLPTDGIQLGISYFKGGIAATLKALATKGYAKILAEPNLLVKSQPISKIGLKPTGGGGSGSLGSCSGEEGYACFMAGKKYPISIVQSVGGTSQTTVTTLDVGVKLVFHAEVLENGLINLKITPASVSAITGTLAVNGYPIIDTREVNTEVELGDGQSLVMAGMLQEEAVKTMSKIPLLGDIPILGALFRSTDDSITEKELVFFVTPKIVKPVKTVDESRFVVKEGQKYELPGDNLPAGLKESDVKVSPEQERDLKWMPLGD
jgi:pilus assembly protein CpaC